MTLHQRHLDSPIGTLTLVASERGVTRILFENEEASAVDAEFADDDPFLEAAADQLLEYFAGERREFDIPLDLVGTDFQREAWMALTDVPYGETTSYGEQAEAIGRPGASRAIGSANNKNPIPIVLPCHRIVGADGLDLKARLLAHERDQQALF